ncbi:methyltransferase domain-containing protein [Trichoderma breve]|nr:methyltransferase domain-containing protein [Trichoderma breve]KAJ4865241.1 methyltransferase domain-containing protein [Trichoderma breve]
MDAEYEMALSSRLQRSKRPLTPLGRDGTVPLDETYAETVNHYGRIFQQHALASKTYFAPIDEEEIARLGEMHSMLGTVFDNRLIFPPVSKPGKILECGFGAADWAVDVAEHYPDAEVVGLDISPHMIPEVLPDNLDLQVDDLNGEFTFPSNYFDVVHSQMMAGGIHATRWPSYLRDMYRVLQPGGWCQLVEIYFNAQSDNGTLSADHALSRWSSGYLDAMHPQKDPRAALRLKEWMRSAGFTDIESRLLTLPMCPWPTDPRDKQIGALNVSNVSQLLYSTGLYPFTQMRGMPAEDFQLLVAQARNEANNPSYRAYFPLYVFIGRKPHP